MGENWIKSILLKRQHRNLQCMSQLKWKMDERYIILSGVNFSCSTLFWTQHFTFFYFYYYLENFWPVFAAATLCLLWFAVQTVLLNDFWDQGDSKKKKKFKWRFKEGGKKRLSVLAENHKGNEP